MTKTKQEAIILGGAQLGLRYGITNRHFLPNTMLYELLDKARYLGFHTLDLAQAYGSVEQRVAMWRHIRRDKNLKFGTKLNLNTQESEHHIWPHGSLRYKYTGLGALDYILLHNPYNFEQGLLQMRMVCPIERIGFSLYYPYELETLLQDVKTARSASAGWEVLQVPYSIVDRRFEPYFGPLGNLGNLNRPLEIQLRSLYLQGLLLVNDISPYARKYPPFWELAPLFNYLARLESNWEYSGVSYYLQRQDILLYAGLRHRQKFPKLRLRLVLGASCAREILELYYSLLRIATWPASLCKELSVELDGLPQLGPKIVVPSQWEIGSLPILE